MRHCNLISKSALRTRVTTTRDIFAHKSMSDTLARDQPPVPAPIKVKLDPGDALRVVAALHEQGSTHHLNQCFAGTDRAPAVVSRL